MSGLTSRSRRAVLASLPGFVLLARGAARAQDSAAFRVVGPANDGFRALYYGVRAGIFTRIGLDVEPTIVPNGAAAAAALIGGSAAVAYTNIVTVIQAHRRNIPMRIVAPATLYASTRPSSTATLALKGSSIRSGADMNGKVLGSIALADIGAVATLAWIDQTGGDSKTVKVIEVPPATAAAVLEEGRADAVTTIEPAVSQALATGNVRVVTRPYDAIAKRFQAGAYAVIEPTVVQNAPRFALFARGLHEAQLYTNAHLPETVDLVASYSGASPQTIAQSVRMIDPEYVDPKLLQPVIDVLAKYGVTDASFPAAEIISSAALKPS